MNMHLHIFKVCDNSSFKKKFIQEINDGFLHQNNLFYLKIVQCFSASSIYQILVFLHAKVDLYSIFEKNLDKCYILGVYAVSFVSFVLLFDETSV